MWRCCTRDFFFIDRKFIYPRLPKTTFFEINPREFSGFLADFLIFADFLKKFSLIQNLSFFCPPIFFSSYIKSTHLWYPKKNSRFNYRNFPGKLDSLRFFDFPNKNYFGYFLNILKQLWLMQFALHMIRHLYILYPVYYIYITYRFKIKFKKRFYKYQIKKY